MNEKLELLFELADALDEKVSRVIGDELSLEKTNLRLLAILFALKELGLLTSHDRGRETWFHFGPKRNLPDDVLPDDVLLVRLKKSEMSRSIELSKRILLTLKNM